MRRNNNDVKKGKIDILRADLRALFPNDSVPKVNRYGRFRPLIDVMTMAELETATKEARLPEPMSVYAMRDATTADVQYPEGWGNGGQKAPVKEGPVIIDTEMKRGARIMTDEERAQTIDGTVYCVHDIDITVCPICSGGEITKETKMREQAQPKTCKHGYLIDPGPCSLCIEEIRKPNEERARKKHNELERRMTEGETEDLMQDNNEELEGMDKDAAQLAAIMARMAAKNKGQLDEERVRALIGEAIKEAGGMRAHVIRIEQKNIEPVEIEGQHGHFPLLHAALSARVPVMMVGPAGSGKTSAAAAAAKALGLGFDLLSVGPMTGEAKFLGYMQAMGEYVETPLYRAYKNGGVFLIDEIDAGNPGVMTVLNALLANDCMTFPSGETVARHADFIPVAAANTFGTGASREYVGRNQLDAATLDRFFFIEWPYDKSLTASMIGINKPRVYKEVGPSGYTAQEWLNVYESAQAACEALKIRHVISPRAVKYGALLINSIKKADLLAGLIFKGLNESQIQQIKTHAGIR